LIRKSSKWQKNIFLILNKSEYNISNNIFII
jgi:hypothetical protein